MTQPKVAIRLGTEGKGDVQRDFADIGAAGDAAANRAARSFEKASGDIESAVRRQASAADKLAAIMPQTPAQARINMNVGTGSSLDEGSARISAAAFRELIAEQERYAAGAAALRAQIDPAWAAQQRFNAEMAEARTLVAANAITLDEYCAKLRMEQGALEQSVGAHGRVAASSGAMRAGWQNAGFQVQDFLVQVNGGTDALRAFSMQAPQMIGALQMMGHNADGAKGRFDKFLSVLGGPWGVAIGVAIPLAVMLGEKIFGMGEKADEAAVKIDSLTEAMKRLHKEQANTADVGEIEKKLNALRDERMSPTIARARGESAESIARRTAARTAELDIQIKELETQIAWNAVAQQGRKDAAKWSGEQGRRGPATPLQFGREVNLTDARGIAERSGFGVTSGYRDYDKQKSLYDSWVAAGKPSDNPVAAPGSSAHERGNALDIAFGPGVTIAAIRKAYAEEGVRLTKILTERGHFHIEWARSAADRQQDKDLEKRFAEQARADLEFEKQRNDWVNDQGAKVGNTARNALEKEGDALTARDNSYRRELDEMSAGTALLNTEWELRGRSRDEIEKAVELKRYQNQLEADTQQYTAEQVAELVKAKDAQLQWADAVQKTAILTDEWRQVGASAIDRLFDPTSAESWGDRVKGVLGDLTNELFKMAAINPLKNLLFNSGLPTLGGGDGGGILGAINGMFGGGKGQSAGGGFVAGGALTNFLGGSAIGNEYTSAGAMWVGENGPELVNMPRGAKVMTASDSKRTMAAAANDRGDTHVHVYADNSLVTEQIVTMISQGIEVASVRGAAGGAALGQAEARASSRRQLGRRW